MKKSPKCEWCDNGDEAEMVDMNGVLCSLSGESGQLSHSYGDDWWPCQRRYEANSDMEIRINEARRECTECGAVSHGLVWVVDSEFEDEVVLCTECVCEASARLDEKS